jgi:hypothetical protein
MGDITIPFMAVGDATFWGIFLVGVVIFGIYWLGKWIWSAVVGG